jgi:hypothetical protein
MQRITPLWAGAAGTSRSEDEEVPTPSAPLTKQDQRRLRDTDLRPSYAAGNGARDAATSALPNIDQPRKK